MVGVLVAVMCAAWIRTRVKLRQHDDSSSISEILKRSHSSLRVIFFVLLLWLDEVISAFQPAAPIMQPYM